MTAVNPRSNNDLKSFCCNGSDSLGIIAVSHVGILFGKVTELTNAVEDERDDDVNDDEEKRSGDVDVCGDDSGRGCCVVDNNSDCLESGEDDNEHNNTVFDVRDGSDVDACEIEDAEE